ncbi:competence protein ComEC [Luteibacter sp. Sphag1AF]|uniref:DNA internalization-related competence protein ComEC/Rec2 n=1 Tax=Luteibacter sp. Sphag1AF TaxID=2587031 RepID=UPI0016108DE8|nr:DNA internalization-related competence protein ComEC/Rec2 [Luteibacter sp. Sphag1AF]MBB3228383.1 competence protein ComEC [Luteibacter sp. Sphag1AF]
MPSVSAEPILPRVAIATLVGVVAAQGLSQLPSPLASALVALAAFGCAWCLRRSAWRWVALVVLGAGWAMLHGSLGLERRLAPEWEGQDMTVIGRIVDLPRSEGADASFVFRPESSTSTSLRGDLRLSWFRVPAPLHACERWQLRVRLKRPRGLANPGPADAERSALQRGIAATGYVRDSVDNQSLTPSNLCADRWRERIASAIDAALGPVDGRLLKALAVGDTRALTPADWSVARATGVSHLIAISGFHVGVAAVGGGALVTVLYACVPWLALRFARRRVQVVVGMIVAIGYGVLAGLSLPTVRTLLMIAVVVLAVCSRRQASGLSTLSLSLLIVLAADPLAVLSGGFWLSFGGVLLLMVCLPPPGRGWRHVLIGLWRTQCLMTAGLFPLCLFFFGAASLVGLPANLVAAPFVSMVVVPLTLLACVCMLLAPVAVSPLLAAASWAMGGQWWVLEQMAAWPGSHVSVPQGGLWRVLLAMLGAMWLFAPRGWPLRSAGTFAFLPLAFPGASVPAHGAFRAWVLDVGQGLAVVVRTQAHVLVYDTGAAYGGGSDAGAGIVLPALDALGIRDIHTLVISHGDNDHAGGAASVAARYPQASVYLGEPARSAIAGKPCDTRQSWHWEGVTFRFIHPAPDDRYRAGNDRSCVLSIEGAASRLLLTGDIGPVAERVLTSREQASRFPTVMTVPHHGSRHSSTAAFVDAYRPSLAVASAGWRNRFHHPHPSVVTRYRAVGDFESTDAAGAVELAFPPTALPFVVRRWREHRSPYWREP